MARAIVASSMLRTAYKLAGSGAGPGRPSLSDLRRATSTAYYALFHQVTRHAALAAFPAADEVEVAQVARWHDHKDVREAARLVVAAASSRTPNPKDAVAVEILRRGSGSVPAELQRVANTFIELQDARLRADYNHEYSPVRYVTLQDVETADRALRATWLMWRAAGSSNQSRRELNAAYCRFLQIASLKTGGPKTRS